ncbi:hypothetical protein E4U41_002390 [Claviceps citrina]|nr:hypothetical protein E4U41_002390 [Claviceps citrina]
MAHAAHATLSSSDSAIAFSTSTSTSVPKTREYMDSLVLPSQDLFEQIAQAQQEKEVQARRRARQHWRHRSSTSCASSEAQNPSSQDKERARAAEVIQKTFRGYRARRELDGYSLNASTRWMAAVREAQFRQSTKPRASAPAPTADEPAGGTGGLLALEDPVDYRPVSARQKWKKASLVARRAGHDDSDSGSDSDSDLDSDMGGGASSPEARIAVKKRSEKAKAERRRAARMMGLQYFLEMVDSKHRYGSNLRMYHEEWKKSNTTENFFYWLDYGEGKDLELDTCPRDRLAREQVRYLSREERQYYLVRVDAEGRLCWVKNGVRIDTTEQFRDSIHGIVPIDDPTPAFSPGEAAQHVHPIDNNDNKNNNNRHSSESDSSVESKREADRAAKYADSSFHGSKGVVKKVRHISASTIFNQLLRKSVKKNTWIFVADTSFRLYVGIKDSGAFQHSSFLQGSRISAAGLIKIKHGRLSSLSPLSGHYRPPASNFRAFVKSLKQEGVDTSHVSISKSYTILVGLETYMKTRRKGKEMMGKLVRSKDKLLAPEEMKKRDEAGRDKSESAARERRILEKEREEEERRKAEMGKGERVAEMVKSLPGLPMRGKDGV